MAQTIYNPEKWLETTMRGIHDYVDDNVDGSVYNVIMEFPGPLLDEQKMPIDRTIIHFEIDDIRTRPLGLGDDPAEWNYDEDTQSVNPQWATVHEIALDVGIWSSDRSGGTTSRMRAFQILQNLFGTPASVQSLRAATTGNDGGVEILRYSGGSAAIDTVNDVRMYRMVDGQLEVRVFSRTPLSDVPAPAIEEIVQSPGLTILG
jgi:hypothetical protein